MPVHILISPCALTGVVRVVERNDGGVLYLVDGKFFTVGKLTRPFAPVVPIALILIRRILVVAASGDRFIPGHLGGLGEGRNNKGRGDDNFTEHLSIDFNIIYIYSLICIMLYISWIAILIFIYILSQFAKK